MDEELRQPENTREFLAMWNTVTSVISRKPIP